VGMDAWGGVPCTAATPTCTAHLRRSCNVRSKPNRGGSHTHRTLIRADPASAQRVHSTNSPEDAEWYERRLTVKL
jgi:hypothetical protein